MLSPGLWLRTTLKIEVNMQHYHFTILLILLEHILYSSDALVLIKFKRVYEHYLKHRESSTNHDPFGDYGLEKRIQLCDDVLNAKQFSIKYPPWYMKRLFTAPMINLTKWDLPPGVPIGTLNYQRSLSARLGGKDSPALQYNEYHQRVRRTTQLIRVKKIQCVRRATINWFVTFGLVDGFMYLIESDGEKAHPRLAAIVEPGPIFDNSDFMQFKSQHEKYKDEMESICLLGFDDYMRLCAAIFDTLDKLGKLAKIISQTIHVKYRDRRCVKKDINMNGKVLREYFLRCNFFFENDDKSYTLFYALADSSECGAAFVFFERERGTLELYARMVKIGALVNPVGPNEVQLNAETQFRDREGKVIRNNNFVSWRELQGLRNERDQLRYHNRSAGTSKRRSRSTRNSERTRHIAPSRDEKELKYKTIQKERSQRKQNVKRMVKLGEELVTTSEDESGHQDDHVLQKSEGSTSGKRRHPRYNVENEDPIEGRASEELEQEYEKNEYQRDELEKVSDSSGENEQASENRTQIFEGRSERKDRTLSELQALVRTFAEHMENDFTNELETPPLLTNPPESWGRRAKRS